MFESIQIKIVGTTLYACNNTAKIIWNPHDFQGAPASPARPAWELVRASRELRGRGEVICIANMNLMESYAIICNLMESYNFFFVFLFLVRVDLIWAGLEVDLVSEIPKASAITFSYRADARLACVFQESAKALRNITIHNDVSNGGSLQNLLGRFAIACFESFMPRIMNSVHSTLREFEQSRVCKNDRGCEHRVSIIANEIRTHIVLNTIIAACREPSRDPAAGRKMIRRRIEPSAHAHTN